MEGTAVILDVRQAPDMRDILDNRALVANFQQIVSISRKTVVGVEGLIRGIDLNTGKTIGATSLFSAAREEMMTLELDRACRDTIFEKFSTVPEYDSDKLLFFNIDASVLETCLGSGYLLNQVLSNHLNPHNIVIEISEKSVLSNAVLKEFVTSYKQHGFMVALDDVGTGFSNMDRILLVKPDIIKIDYSLIHNIHSDFYKQGVFKSLVILANKIGALVIAEGVESEEEAIQVLRLGGHMIQGFYLSMPAAISDKNALFANNKIDFLSKRFNEYMKMQYLREKNKYKQFNRIVKESVVKLTGQSGEDFDDILGGIVSGCSDMDCAYILDSAGVQISETICGDGTGNKRENQIFYSAKQGTDHSMEKYYYPLVSAKRKRYTTEPYISLATGNLCVTISAVFECANDQKCILCADFVTVEDSYNIELRGPVDNRSVGDNKEIAGILSKMNTEIITDSLTGAYNRRYLSERLLSDMNNAKNDKQPLSIILADIDLFKDVNDRFGHLAGDQVLKDFVALTKQYIRKDSDWIARYGGDEFLIVLINANETAAARVAEKIRSACENMPVIHAATAIHFTVSLGSYTLFSEKLSMEDVIELADKNLYIAKKSGRNSVIVERETAN